MENSNPCFCNEEHNKSGKSSTAFFDTAMRFYLNTELHEL